MDDQVSMNARVEALDQIEQLRQRHWADFTAQQQADALRGLADYLAGRQDLANSMTLRSEALLLASRLGPGVGESPIAWPTLTDSQLAGRLREMAVENRDTTREAFSDSCLDLSDQLERTRQRAGYDRDR